MKNENTKGEKMNPVLRTQWTNILKYLTPGIFIGAMALGMFGAPAWLVGATASFTFLSGAFLCLFYAMMPVRPERGENSLTVMMRQVYGYSLAFVLFVAFAWVLWRALHF